jgi:ligand-binding sensor domain-containing protein
MPQRHRFRTRFAAAIAAVAALAVAPVVAQIGRSVPARAAGTDTYTTQLTVDSFEGGSDLAFDPQGHLWVAEASTRTLKQYDAQDPAAGPTLVIQGTAASGDGLVFDSAGDAFVASGGDVLCFSAATLASAAPTVADAQTVFTGRQDVSGLTIASDGALWISDSSSRTVYRLPNPAQDLGTPQTPTTVITDQTGDGPRALAFDQSGDLWVDYGASVKEFTAAQLQATSPIADTTARLTILTFDYCTDLAVGPAGGIWMADDDDWLYELSAQDAQAAGSTFDVDSLHQVYDETNYMGTLAFDTSGNIWLGSSWDGITEYPAADVTALSLSSGDAVAALGSVYPWRLAAPSSGGLWVAGANSSYELYGFSSTVLATPPATAADATVTTNNWWAEGGFAADTSGGIWLRNGSNNDVGLFAADPASSTFPSSPTTTITGLNLAGGMTTDRFGNFYTAVYNSQNSQYRVVELSACALSGGGTVTAPWARTVISNYEPSELAVDADGNIWGVTYNALEEFTAASFQDGPATTPTRTITGFNDLSGVSIDAAGNVWAADEYGDAVYEFQAADLGAASLTVADAATTISVPLPMSIASDPAGGMWIGNDDGVYRAVPAGGPVATPTPVATVPFDASTCPVWTPTPTPTGSVTTVTAPGPTVTATATVPGPTVTSTTTAPGPTVTSVVTVSAPAPAPATVTATVQAPVPYVYVNPKVAQKVQAAQKTLVLPRGHSMVLAAYGYTAAGKQLRVRWHSSNTQVATVIASGRITAHRAGHAVVTASWGSLAWRVRLTVSGQSAKVRKVKGVRVTGLATHLTVGQNEWVAAAARPGAATSAKVTFKSSRPSVVHIDKAGHLEARAPGTVRLRVKVTGVKNAVSRVFTLTVA